MDTAAETSVVVPPEDRFKRLRVKVLKPPGGDSHDIFADGDAKTMSHSRILKPPGGGSSDIFNTNGMSGDSPRRVKNYMKSSIFDESNGASPTLATAGSPSTRAGTHHSSNIFGEANNAPQQPRKVKDYMKSNIFGSDENDNKQQENGNYNPITGEANETNGDGEAKETVQPCIRIRNPPGGPSTKLW